MELRGRHSGKHSQILHNQCILLVPPGTEDSTSRIGTSENGLKGGANFWRGKVPKPVRETKSTVSTRSLFGTCFFFGLIRAVGAPCLNTTATYRELFIVNSGNKKNEHQPTSKMLVCGQCGGVVFKSPQCSVLTSPFTGPGSLCKHNPCLSDPNGLWSQPVTSTANQQFNRPRFSLPKGSIVSGKHFHGRHSPVL
jgi:hypothetical protein